MYAARAPAGLDSGMTTGASGGLSGAPRGDINWGALPLAVMQHPTPLLVGTAFVIVIALQDISMSTALITGLVLCLVEAGLTTGLYSMGRLKHYSYALNHCFLWPLLVWVVVMWYNKPLFHTWMTIALWGGVTTLMSLTMMLNRPWARDLLKDKSPAATWDSEWWDNLAAAITRTWVIMFALMTASAYVPYFWHQTGTLGALNIIFNYIVPILLGSLGLAITDGLVTKSLEAQWGLGSSSAGVGAGGVYEPLVGSTNPGV